MASGQFSHSADVRNVFMKGSKVVYLHHYSTGDLWHNFLLSTMHSDTAVNTDEQKKPHMIMYCNKYITGVDTMDRMVSRYTCHRRTQRWPLAMFFNILDVGALAAYLIYYENNNMLKTKNKSATYFLASIE